MGCSTPGLSVFHYFLEFAQTHIHWISDAIHPSHPVFQFSSCLRSFPASGSFSNDLALRIRWSKCWSFSFSISSSSEYSGLISFRIDWFNLLPAQGTLKRLLQHHSWKTSFLQHSAFLMVQLSHLYITTGKTTALTTWTFVGKTLPAWYPTGDRPRNHNHFLITSYQSGPIRKIVLCVYQLYIVSSVLCLWMLFWELYLPGFEDIIHFYIISYSLPLTLDISFFREDPLSCSLSNASFRS